MGEGVGIRDKREEKTTISLFRVYEKHKKAFRTWQEKFSASYANGTYNALEKLSKVVDDTSPKTITSSIESNELDMQYCVKGIRIFLNFCEEKELLDDTFILKYRNNFKIKKNGIDSYVPQEKDIQRSISIIKNEYPQFNLLYQLMIESGCRYTEVVEMVINFEEKNIEVYDEKIVLYRNFYLRGKKSSYYLFMSFKTYTQLILELENIS